ncbi:MAG: AMP-binding protein, partial [Alphaproteobacteria bacterium]
LSNTRAAASLYELDRTQWSLVTLPLSHAYGLMVMNSGLALGTRAVLLSWFNPELVLDTIQAYRVQTMSAVPTMLNYLLNYPDSDRFDTSSMRVWGSGAAPLPIEIVAPFEKKFGGRILEGYGLTEGVAVATCNPATGANKEGSIGLPFPGTVVEIARADGFGGLARAGEIGEICLRGPQVMKGYWRQPEATARVLRSGRLLTGDLGFLDEEGYTHIVGRSKDLILVGGYNVYPSAVEAAILMNPCVAEVAVCGVPDVHRGEMVAAFVVLREGAGLTTRELKDFLRDKLASFELPRRIAFRPALPRGADGKVAKAELAASIARKRERAGTEHAEAA